MSGADSEGPIGTRDRIHQRTCCARGSSTAPAAISVVNILEYPVLVVDSSLIATQNVTKCVSRTRYAVSTGATGRLYHLVSCSDPGTAWFPRRWSSGAVYVVIIVPLPVSRERSLRASRPSRLHAKRPEAGRRRQPRPDQASHVLST